MEDTYYKGFTDGYEAFWRTEKERGVLPKGAYKQPKRNGRKQIAHAQSVCRGATAGGIYAYQNGFIPGPCAKRNGRVGGEIPTEFKEIVAKYF